MSDTTTRPVVTGVTAYLMARGASDASAFYQKAFAAEELSRMLHEQTGKLMHCHLRINGGDVMMSDEFPEYGMGLGDGPKGVTLHLQVDDADAWFERAVAAGATVTMPLADQFWGDRYGQLKDPFGHSWSIGSSPK
jgi:PhnB protein